MARILIADDSFLMRKNLKTIFSQAGHEVVSEASNGKAAVRAYREVRPDLVTMDITMPVMSGIDAVKEIIEEFPDACIVMITAIDQKHMVFQAINYGARHYIIKPFNVSKVLSVVNTVLDNSVPEPEKDASYTVEKNGERYCITIRERISPETLTMISGTVQGLLLTRPQGFLFDLTTNPSSDEVFLQIKPLVRMIEEKGGNVDVRL